MKYFENFLNGQGSELSPTRFGYFAVGEPSFLTILRKGERNIRLATIERALDFVRTYVKNEELKAKGTGESNGNVNVSVGSRN